MGLMLMTTLDRVRAAANIPSNVTAHDADLMSALVAASAAIQGIMSRPVSVERRMETRWATPSGFMFLKAFPVRSIESVAVAIGQGQYRTLTPQEYWLADSNELHLPPIKNRTPVNITYTGGIAYSVDTSLVAVASITGTPTPGAFTTNAGATGTLLAYDAGAGTASLKITHGALTFGAVVTGADWTITPGETLQESMISDANDLAKACEMQAVYIYQRRNSLGRTGVTAGNGMTTFQDDYDILKGVKTIINIYDPQLVG